MATTTNYSWTTPDDTALVKDGAAAIRTLGSSVDTTVKALNPGTTAGDIDYYTTSTAKARIAIGTAGQVLTVNSGATAPEWATSASGGMTLLSTTTLSGASVTISAISQDYNTLFILFRNPFHNTASRKMIIKPNATSSIADWTQNAYINAAVENSGNNAGDLQTTVNIATATNATRNNSALTIFNYTDTTHGKPFNWVGTQPTSNANFQFSGAFRTASAISSIEISTDGSGTFSGGTVLIYGVK